jgi:hypothetical protein
MDNKRMEYLFLERTFRWLVEGGVLLMMVPQERLDYAIPLLAGNFTGLRIFRLTDPEAERFGQVALFGVRKRIRGEHYDRNRSQLVEMVWRNPIPVLSGAETTYSVPPAQAVPLVYHGLPFDQIEDLVPASAACQQVAPFLLPRECAGWATDHTSPCRPRRAALHGRTTERYVRAGKRSPYRTFTNCLRQAFIGSLCVSRNGSVPFGVQSETSMLPVFGSPC